MTMDEALDAFAQVDSFPEAAMRWVLDEWDSTGPVCRALLRDYAAGIDTSERTERALDIIVHLMGDKADTRSFSLLCRLAMDAERCNSVFGDDGMTVSLLPILTSTFDGDPAALHLLVETPTVEDLLRGDVLLVLAYLARTRRIAEADAYQYLAGLPDRLQPQEEAYVWFGWVRAVSALGFAGLSGRVEQAFGRGLIDPSIMEAADFWSDLREAQEDPHGTSARVWDGVGPFGSAIDWLRPGADVADFDEPEPTAPLRNPLRHVGRNDPCPCGSGKKYKKCCLAA